MPSQQHDVLAELFRDDPELAPKLVADLGVQPPAFQAVRAVSESFTDLKTSGFSGDVAVLCETDAAVFGVIVEVQRREDDNKHYAWPVYHAVFRARYRCPAVLMVIAPDPAVADWCTRPIVTGQPGYVLRPLVLRSAQVPVLTNGSEIAADPALAVLSAAFHATGPAGDKVLAGVLDGTATLHQTNRNLAKRYNDFVLSVLPEAARRRLEVMLKTDESRPYRSELFRSLVAKGEVKGKAEGEAKGKAESVINVLRARGIEVPASAREWILGCTDIAQLDSWLTQALTVTSVDQLKP
jgi:hypothetical protein